MRDTLSSRHAELDISIDTASQPPIEEKDRGRALRPLSTMCDAMLMWSDIHLAITSPSPPIPPRNRHCPASIPTSFPQETTIFPTCLVCDMKRSALETLDRANVEMGSGWMIPAASEAEALLRSAPSVLCLRKSTASTEYARSARSCAC